MKYRLKNDRFEHPAGSVVYKCHMCDYGCVSDDNRFTGVEHTKVTLDPDGGYPFFTVPVNDLEPLPEGGAA